MNQIPFDVLEYYNLPHLNLATLFKLCQTNKRLANFCTRESIWKNKVLTEFGPEVKPEDVSWKDFAYQLLFNSRIVKLFLYMFIEIGTIRIFGYETIPEIIEKLIPIFNKEVRQYNITVVLRIGKDKFNMLLTDFPQNKSINTIKLTDSNFTIFNKYPNVYLWNTNFYFTA